MFHSDALSVSQAERISAELKEDGVDFIITDYPIVTHEDAMHLRDWLRYQWYWQEKIKNNPRVGGRHIITINN